MKLGLGPQPRQECCCLVFWTRVEDVAGKRCGHGPSTKGDAPHVRVFESFFCVNVERDHLVIWASSTTVSIYYSPCIRHFSAVIKRRSESGKKVQETPICAQAKLHHWNLAWRTWEWNPGKLDGWRVFFKIQLQTNINTYYKQFSHL